MELDLLVHGFVDDFCVFLLSPTLRLLLFLLSPHSDFGWISRLGLVIFVVVDIPTL